MGAWGRRRAAFAVAFVGAARIYWLKVFPGVRREAARWLERAESIPAPRLREVAAATLLDEAGNLEGAGAFAVLARGGARMQIVRAVVAFQALYDYVDSLAELEPTGGVGRTRVLHQALDLAIAPARPVDHHTAPHPWAADGGYLVSIMDVCRTACARLPTHALVRPPAQRAVSRMVEYQALIHMPGSPGALAAWATGEMPPHAELRWWETAAAGASSLGVFALLAAATRPTLDGRHVAALEAAYFPWVGALHVLLDSLVDVPTDDRTGHLNLIRQYDSDEEAADRIAAIAARAIQAAHALPDGDRHALLVTAMAAFYLSAPSASRPEVVAITRRVAQAVGDVAPLIGGVHRLRRAGRRT